MLVVFFVVVLPVFAEHPKIVSQFNVEIDRDGSRILS
jgi:hypothetical protein